MMLISLDSTGMSNSSNLAIRHNVSLEIRHSGSSSSLIRKALEHVCTFRHVLKCFAVVGQAEVNA